MDKNHPTLSAEQSRAAYAMANALCIIAGPGAGKSTTLIERYRFLLEQYAAPEIRIITFTRNAARSLREKITARGLPAPGYVGTLHGFARLHFPSPNLSEEDADEILKDTAAKLKCKDGVATLRQVLTGLKKGTDLQEIVCRHFAARLEQENLTDNDVILIRFRNHLKNLPVKPYGALLVDEAQDSGTLDWEIYRLIPSLSITVVGDPLQSMYAFRGGRPDLIEEFADAPGVCGLFLNDNYRSGSAVVNAANSLSGRQFVSQNQSIIGAVTVREVASEFDECKIIMATCKGHVESGNTGTIAILCRYNAEVKLFTRLLRGAGLMPPGEESRTPDDWTRAEAAVRYHADPDNLILQKLLRRSWKGKGLTDPKGLSLEALMTAAAISARTIRRVLELKAGTTTPGDHLEAMREAVATPEPPRGQITVMTFHASKGLEFDHVIIPAMDMKPGTVMDKEELRCFFVALTRARTSVHCTASATRTNFFNGQLEDRIPSPFLNAISATAYYKVDATTATATVPA